MISLIVIVTPISVITIFEFFFNDDRGKGDFKQTSLGKMSEGEGHKYADIWYYTFSLVLRKLPFLITFFTLGFSIINNEIGDWFHDFYVKYIPYESSIFVATIGVMVVIHMESLTQYIGHRLAHKVPLLWDFHELHHSSTKMTILSINRESPLDEVFTFPITVPITALSGLLLNEYIKQDLMLPFFIYLAYMIIKDLNGLLGHSSLKMVYPKPLSYILMSPALHWLHHSENPKHFDCNLSNDIVIWDKVFGTYLGEEYLEEIESYGVHNTEYNKHHPLYSVTVLPVLKLTRRIKKVMA
ncbi:MULTISPECIES: sterol desaturase family protein [unclassified Prochlorococcus]|uniref:sterol desaturase family protein n=1 Tax=unclassified Prochlorococcus TaxID=2627481 RepID=UPI0005339244|nr:MULTISPECIES: sterol desaturase family protein [unclassified Prochlorococcus]KGG14947.1 Sterol desaturase [Prochlorococcus sp. MIT 0602]KGG15619.1 Sterol desaturase [Prochlorococcus sp. MIT 0603]